MHIFEIDRLEQIVGKDRVRKEEPLAKHTTFRIGGPAKWFVEPESAEQLAACIKYLEEVQMQWYILGNGSNLLVADEGYDGVILSLHRMNKEAEQIGELIAFVKSIKPEVICMVDNCYGEFVERIEPSDLGADMVVGSLIKNPGGGLAPIGGYIAGTRQCIENAAYRLGSPGLGREVGASLGVNQSFFQGLFLAPTVVSGALKGAIFAANVYERLGFDVVPNSTEPRYDIIQAITFGKPEGVIAFCQGIQAAAPVDSYVSPEPWDMPGYDSQVIMAAGAFIQGSSIELSADGPIKPPYSVFFQGGLTWYHAKLGILMSLQKLLDAGIVKPEQLKID